MIYGIARPRRVPVFDILFLLGLAFCGLLMIGIFDVGLGAFAGAAAGVAVLGVLAIRWPVATTAAFVAFTPVNRFVIMLVYHFTHSGIFTKGFELWKDGVLIALVIRVVYDLVFTPERSHKLRVMDMLVLLFMGVSVLYLIYPGSIEVDLFTRLQGFRSDSEFMLAYWVGRGLHLNRAQLKAILLAIVPGSVLVALVAVWQFAAPGMANAFFGFIGYAEFVVFSGNTGDPIAVRYRDVPGAESLPRASSLLLSDLALAFFQLLTISIAIAMHGMARKALARVATGIFVGLMVVTLALTLTRSAIGAGAASIAAGIVASRAYFRFVILGLVGAAVACLLIAAGTIKVTTFQSLANLQDPSSIQHGLMVSKSIQIVEQTPLGRGLGSGGAVGQTQLKDNESITSESWYLQLGTEMGVPGMVTYTLLVVAATLISFWYFFRVRDYWLRILSLSVAGSSLAMLIAGNFLHAWENTPVSMVIWLLVGIATRAGDLDRSPDYSPRT